MSARILLPNIAPDEISKATVEQSLNLTFRGKDKIGQEMEDAVWAELFEALNLFSEEE